MFPLFPSSPWQYLGVLFTLHMFGIAATPSPRLVSSDMLNWRLICFKEKHLASS